MKNLKTLAFCIEKCYDKYVNRCLLVIRVGDTSTLICCIVHYFRSPDRRVAQRNGEGSCGPFSI